ncbi:MAG: DUF4143 domain-containing protein [Candidatus Firestonebacteria bacterium]
MTPQKALMLLNETGGFPEPFISGTAEETARWQKQYYTDVIRDEISDLWTIHEMRSLKILLEMLRERVGSPLSFRSLAEDLQVSPNTVKKYIYILEALYVLFLVRPYSKNIVKSISREPKMYFYDSGYVKGDAGIKLENTVAVSLLKHAQYLEDSSGKNIELNYLRNRQGAEVDFALSESGEIKKMIEVKVSDDNPSKGIRYFHTKIPECEAIQIVQNSAVKKDTGGIKVRPAAEWLSELQA